MKSVMLSIKPYWLFLIIAEKMGWNIGKKKTIEVRKSYPKDTGWNKSVILYCTKDYNSLNKIPKEYRPLMKLMLGKVIGEFVCDKIGTISRIQHIGYIVVKLKNIEEDSCLSLKEIGDYIDYKKGYGWHISDLVIYGEPKELSEFRKPCKYGEETEIPCSVCDKSRYSSDRFIDCFNIVERPPQSWCYVEELK